MNVARRVPLRVRSALAWPALFWAGCEILSINTQPRGRAQVDSSDATVRSRDAEQPGPECGASGERCDGIYGDCDERSEDDFGHDPENCGGCGIRCAREHATTACVDGTCRIVDCVEGFTNADGIDSTGCENPQCISGDNILRDAGVPDAEVLPLGCDPPTPNDASQPRSCTDFARCIRSAGGGVDFEYSSCARDGGVTFATCEVATEVDMSSFAMTSGESPLLEVQLSVKREFRGALNLWYGRHPLRRFLPLRRAGESLPVGCHLFRYLQPSDARFPDWCGIPSSCFSADAGPDVFCPDERCFGEFQAATRQWAKGQIDQKCYQPGKMPSEGFDQFDLKHTMLTLVGEWGEDGCLSGSVHLDSIRLLSSSCRCAGDSSCAGQSDRTHCYALAANGCTPAGGSAGGVCGPEQVACSGPPHHGSTCNVTTERGTFLGTIRCDAASCACLLE